MDSLFIAEFKIYEWKFKAPGRGKRKKKSDPKLTKIFKTKHPAVGGGSRKVPDLV